MALPAPIRRPAPRELYRTPSSLSVAAGALGTVIDLNPLNYPFLVVHVRADTAHLFSPRISFRSTGTAMPLGPTSQAIAIAGSWDGELRFVSDVVDARSDRATVYVNNLSGDAHTYDVLVYGIG